MGVLLHQSHDPEYPQINHLARVLVTHLQDPDAPYHSDHRLRTDYLKILYTNADQFVNKRDDLLMLIAGNEPDIILINETIPKAQSLPIGI